MTNRFAKRINEDCVILMRIVVRMANVCDRVGLIEELEAIERAVQKLDAEARKLWDQKAVRNGA